MEYLKMTKTKTKLRDICYNVTDSDDTFVGIKFIENEARIYFPLGYNIPDSEKNCKRSIYDLINAINLVKTEKSDKKYSETNGDTPDIPLNSYIWLINDYLENGLYTELEKRYKEKINGKINWKKTLKTKSYISNNNIVYLNPVVEKSTKEENIITRVQVLCLKKSLEKLSWLYGNIFLPSINIDDSNTDYYLTILKTKLINSYLDHKKQLINHMILVLEEKSNENLKNKSAKYGTYHFNIAWEKMVTKVYGNIDANDFFPSANYNLVNKKNFKTPDMYPDTILNYNNNLYILDSKYYKFGIVDDDYPNTLPSTPSIDKQIMYGKYASNNDEKREKYEFNNVYNAFILPFNKDDNRFDIKSVIEYRGYAESGSTKGQVTNTYEKIALILIDTKYIMDCYFQNEDNKLDELIKNIHRIEKSE